MPYRVSCYNYQFANNGKHYIVNLKTGLHSLRSLKDEEVVFLSSLENKSTFCARDELLLQKFLDGGYVIPLDRDEGNEISLRKLDSVFNPVLQVVIHVTHDCNFRCKYCFIDFDKRNISDSTQEGIITFLKHNLYRFSGLHISWFGGEPLCALEIIERMSRKITEICRECKKPYVASITTNGFLLDVSSFNTLLSCRVINYCVTVDGLQDTHDSQRVLENGEGTFAAIINNLRVIRDNVKGNRFKICIRTNLTKKSLDEFPDYLDFFTNEFGGDERFTAMFKIADDWGGTRIDQFRDSLLPKSALKRAFQIAAEKYFSSYVENISEVSGGGMTCSASKRNKYTIGVDGIISKCDTPCEETKIGQVDESGWHIDEVKESDWLSLALSSKSKCENCLFHCMCLGGACPKKKVLNGSDSCPRPVYLKQLLVLYANLCEINDSQTGNNIRT